jgi:hypothetical protein
MPMFTVQFIKVIKEVSIISVCTHCSLPKVKEETKASAFVALPCWCSFILQGLCG